MYLSAIETLFCQTKIEFNTMHDFQYIVLNSYCGIVFDKCHKKSFIDIMKADSPRPYSSLAKLITRNKCASFTGMRRLATNKREVSIPKQFSVLLSSILLGECLILS